MAVARTALLQFQSCVRTTLLLSDGYECQEKVNCPLCCCIKLEPSFLDEDFDACTSSISQERQPMSTFAVVHEWLTRCAERSVFSCDVS